MAELALLKRTIDEASGILRVRFKVTTEEESRFVTPDVVFGDRSAYDVENTRIVIQTEHLDDMQVVGEEVSHYLHEQLNSSLWRTQDPSDLYGREYIVECVGHYGAIVYLRDRGVDYKQVEFSGILPVEEGVG